MANSSEMERHNQMMTFMTEFRQSMEASIAATNTKIGDTNDKLDKRMDSINKEMKEINHRLDKHKEEETMYLKGWRIDYRN